MPGGPQNIQHRSRAKQSGYSKSGNQSDDSKKRKQHPFLSRSVHGWLSRWGENFGKKEISLQTLKKIAIFLAVFFFGCLFVFPKTLSSTSRPKFNELQSGPKRATSDDRLVNSTYDAIHKNPEPKQSISNNHLIDFTYGTILAGRSSVGTYKNLESVRFQSVEKSHDNNIAGLRVCIFTAEFAGIFPTGGIGYVLSELANLLASQKAHVTVAYLGSGKLDENSVKDLDNRGVNFVTVPESDIPLSPNHISLVGSYRALLYLMNKQNKFDIIHFNDYLGHAIYPLYARRQGWLLENTKVVITLHGTANWARLANKQYPQNYDDISVNWIEREAISAADFIWAPSKFIATSLLAEGVVLPENVVVLKNAPPTIEQDSSMHVGSFRGTFEKNTSFITEITFFGRLEMRKGPLLFIAALEELSKKYPAILKNIEISFLGRDTPVDDLHSYKEKIRQDFDSSPNLMKLNLSFLDNFDRNQAISYISNPHRLIVISSMIENLPGTVFECIEFGANFIAADVGGIKEMIHSDDADRCLFKPLPLSFASKLHEKITENHEDIKPVRHSETPNSIRSDIITFHKQIYQASSMYPVMNNPVMNFLRQRTKSNPKITICLTHYNRVQTLLSSLNEWKKQSYNNYNIIVVDDESPEEAQKELDRKVLPLINEWGWKLLKIKHSYLGAARNKCVEAASSDTDYFFFTDDDDFVASNALQILTDIAQHVKADIVTAFFHRFHANSLKEAMERKAENIWMFSGGSLAMGILQNSFGGALMLVATKAFQTVGGFSEFDIVGCEDWEFYMKAVTKGLRVEIVPNQDLLYTQKKDVSMSTSMDLKLCRYRAMSPALSQYPNLADSFLMLRGVADATAEKPKQELRWSSMSHIGQQTSNGWEYGYCVHEVGKKVTLPDCHFQYLPNFSEDQARYDMHSLTGTPWPFVGRHGMHPSNSMLDGTLKSVTVLRQFKSNIIGDMTIHLSINKDSSCGDGVQAQLYFGSELIWGPTHILLGSEPVEWYSTRLKVQPGDSILLMISPLETDECDSVHVRLDIIAAEKQFY